MKKKMSKAVLVTLILSLIMSMSVALSGCGGPANLEEFINSNEEAKQALESFNTDGLTVEVKENTVIYTYQYDQTFDSSVIGAMADSLESSIENSSASFTSIADTLEQESGIEEISVKVIYLNGDGSEIFSKEF